MRKRIGFVCVLLLAVLIAEAQHTGDTLLRHRIGIGAGLTTGMGLSYRYVPSRFGIQVNFAPIVMNDMTTVSVGATFLWYLIPGRVASLYLYQGNHYYYHTETWYYADPAKTLNTSDKTDYYTKSTESYMNNGLGFGMELAFAERITFNLMAGYAAYVNFTQVNVTGETALYFKF